MTKSRWDETWHRLREWTNEQGPSERLAAQLVIYEGFVGVDPSHPLGGRDGGRDAVCLRNGEPWVMAVYFPRGQQTFADIRRKLLADVQAAQKHSPVGAVFVTNQELTLSERKALSDEVAISLELLHLERITAILDDPKMSGIRRQFLDIGGDEDQVIQLGGQGGMAPGAGGGGGGAIGEGATGGKGGDGGKITLAGSPATAPGAGGGGAGAEGDGAQGGDGGSGGNMVYALIGPQKLAALRAAGFERMEFRVGMGGAQGGPGEDSVVNFVTADGTVLESIAAKGGRPGNPPPLAAGARHVTTNDIADGFRVMSLLLADCVHTKGGLLYLLGAGWAHYQVPTVPFEVQWPLSITVDTGAISAGTRVSLEVVVKQPDGFQVAAFPVEIQSVADVVPRINSFVPIAFSGSMVGKWFIELRSGGIILQSMPIEVKTPG